MTPFLLDRYMEAVETFLDNFFTSTGENLVMVEGTVKWKLSETFYIYCTK